MSSGIDAVEVKEIQHSGTGPDAQELHDATAAPPKLPRGARFLRTGLCTVVVLCLVVTVVHVLLVFLHVAPANTVSKRYSSRINAWVFPFFEQNWRLFAPDPESVNRQILARTARTDSDGSFEVSPWFDLTAVDGSAVEHHVFPSHTAQNMLRRSWSGYVDSHGGDDSARTERAVMMRKYLTNIAADRLAAQQGGTFDFVQLRVVTLPVAALGSSAGDRPQKPAENRLLPWWKVPRHAE
ncbi:DUF5819 family protein [Streptomyces afghaniensis]|uniref:DUF5819 family protein n=1 Tax=Streptomyces afghaniensis TaxID=66865 RepID=UPI00277D9189|nr:DUF5819 family protein [Streptomyces afghaniensis]MDQ1017568.1 hypothetical protein [Streptomyces afghaniensis]